MEGKYPIIIDGAPLGALEVKKNGARTVFAARCRMVEGLLRLSVYGGGKEGYLGVMIPESGELTLSRSLSPLDMRAFPGTIESVGRAGQAAVPVFAERDLSPAPQSPDASPAPRPPQDASPAPQPPQDASPAPQPPQDASPAPQPPQAASPAPQPPEQPCTPEPPCRPCDLCWYASPDGALVSFDGEKNYIALPPGDYRIPANQSGEARVIEGREYLVFVSKNGRITL